MWKKSKYSSKKLCIVSAKRGSCCLFIAILTLEWIYSIYEIIENCVCKDTKNTCSVVQKQFAGGSKQIN